MKKAKNKRKRIIFVCKREKIIERVNYFVLLYFFLFFNGKQMRKKPRDLAQENANCQSKEDQDSTCNDTSY